MTTRRSTPAADARGQLALFRRGGARKGAGRKPKGEHALVPHGKRARITRHTPIFVTSHLCSDLPSLRGERAVAVLRSTLVAGADRFGFRLIEYSIQSNHLHFVVEADDRTALARGMKGVLVRVARALDRVWQRRGSVMLDRYHARVLRTPREVRNVLVYVLTNARKHGARFLGVDAHTSGRWFTGWLDRVVCEPSPLARATSWLLRTGWRRWGCIATGDAPRGSANEAVPQDLVFPRPVIWR